MSDCLKQAALRYAEQGFRVFPCASGSKKPVAGSNGLKDASGDQEQVAAWWAQHPDANIGLATDGLLVVDVDGSENPWLTPEREAKLAQAATTDTPSGGSHFFFQAPAGMSFRNTVGAIAEHVDTRADGGYVLVAPSVVDGKRYAWRPMFELECGPGQLPEPPGEILAALAEKSSRETQRAECGVVIPEGKRNSTLTSFAGALRRIGSSESQIAATLLAKNHEECQPPLSDREVRAIAASVSRYEPDQVAQIVANGDLPTLNGGGDSVAKMLVTAPAFDMEALFPPGTERARDFFIELSRSTQTPPEMSALLGLAVVSSTLANVHRIRGHGDHIEPAQIWGLVASEPATRKSAVVKALTAPIHAWERAKAEAMRLEIAKAEQHERMLKSRRDELEKKAGKELDPAKRVRLFEDASKAAIELEDHQTPSPPLLIASEPTPEALALQMSLNSERALLASPEADALDIMQGRYGKQPNYGIYLKGHAGDAVRETRITRGAVHMESPALAMALCVQPQALGALWVDKQAAGRGLLARFAVIAPDSLVGRREIRPDPMQDAVKEGWAALLTGLLELRPVDSDTDERAPIGLGQDADEAYKELQIRVEAALGDGDLAARKEWGGKLCGLVLRFALTLHAIEITGRSEIAAIDEPVGEGVMRAAIAWGKYLVRSEEHARSILVAPADSQRQRDLVLRIHRLGNEVSVRDWQNSGGHQRADDARAELQELAELGIGRMERRKAGPTGGRPSEVFALNAGYRAADTTRQNPSDDGGESP